MRFWQLRGNFCGSWLKNFQSSSEKWKNNIFPDKNYPSKYFFRKEKKKRVFPLKKRNFPQKLPIDMQIAVLNTTSQKVSTEIRKEVRSLSKGHNLKKKFPTKTFLLKIFQWTGRMQIWNSSQNNFDKIQSFFFQCATMTKNINFFNKNVFPQNVPLGMQKSVLTTPLTNFQKKPGKTSLKIRKDKKVSIFQYFLLKPFFYTGRMQFLRHSQKNWQLAEKFAVNMW